MSFVNLLSSDIWSSKDITNRTESLIHSTISKQEENILSRKMIAFSMGLLVPTSKESELLTQYEIVSYIAQKEGIDAIADMKLLSSVMNYEKFKKRLEISPITEPISVTITVDGEEIEIENPEIISDAKERDIAKTAIDTASSEIIDLFNLRNPVVQIVEQDIVNPELVE